VSPRSGAGKGVARRLRAGGRIPGVCYGREIPAASISLDARALERLISTSEAGVNTLIGLSVEGGGAYDGRQVLIKELQRDPVTGRLLHADFYAVDLTQVVKVSVPIHVRGMPEGVKMGGILDQSLRELELECLPQAIPTEILVDVSALVIGQSLHVRDLDLPADVELVSDPDLSVVSVMVPAAEEVAAPEAAEVAVGEEAAEGAEPGAAPAGAEGAGEESGGD
jgi:large subunit ribosomal protein L25